VRKTGEKGANRKGSFFLLFIDRFRSMAIWKNRFFFQKSGKLFFLMAMENSKK